MIAAEIVRSNSRNRGLCCVPFEFRRLSLGFRISCGMVPPGESSLLSQQFQATRVADNESRNRICDRSSEFRAGTRPDPRIT